MRNKAVSRGRAALTVACWLLAIGGCTSVDPEQAQDNFPEMTDDLIAAWPTPPVAITPSLVAVKPTVINHGPRRLKRIALTFDACSLDAESYYDERVARILIDMNVPATLFVGGKWMRDHPEQLRALAALPQFELANHGFMHPHMTTLSDERMRQEIKWTQDTMYAMIGRQPTLFRAPYGEINHRVVKLAAENGLRTVQFDLPSGDADKKASKSKLIEYVSTVAKPGSIVVMHINRRGWNTAEALPDIVRKLRKRGFEFVTVSELLGL
ncbi:MAG TPA: polysaccharide deacetylase family protein, partial [Burkholderiales bacterium]|nr:polysaccharide deacetylase family protein [Burkholderiales bacterium]